MKTRQLDVHPFPDYPVRPSYTQSVSDPEELLLLDMTGGNDEHLMSWFCWEAMRHYTNGDFMH